MKRILYIIFTVMLASMLCFAVFAEPYGAEEGGLAELPSQTPYISEEIYLEEAYSLIFTVSYDNSLTNPPEILFVSPYGEIIQASTLESEINSELGVAMYKLPRTTEGTWTVNAYGECTINYMSYMEPLKIEGIELGEVNNGRMNVTFTVSSALEGEYRYEIFAVVCDESGNVTGEKLLADGYGYIDEPESYNVYINELSDYPNYKIRVDAWQTSGVEEVSVSALSDGVFEISGNGIDDSIDNFRVTVDLNGETVKVDWSEWAEYGMNEYFLAVYADSSDEPFYFDTFERSVTSCEFFNKQDAASIRISLIYRTNGRNSKPNEKVIPLDSLVVFEFPESALTSSRQYDISCIGVPADGVDLNVSVNETSETLNVTEDTSFSVALEEDYNKIVISYFLNDENVVYVCTHEAVLDIYAPSLNLPEHRDAINVADAEFSITGTTDADSTVTVDGKEVTVNADGTFISAVTLNPGKNIIRVTASDKAGNVAAHDVVIYTEDTSGVKEENNSWIDLVLEYLPLIVSFVVSVAFVIAVRTVFTKYDNAENKKVFRLRALRNIFIGVSVLCATGSVYFLVRFLDVDGKTKKAEFLEKTAEEMAAMLEQKDSYGLFFWLLFALLLVSAVVFTVMIILLARKNKPDKPKKQKKSEKNERAEELFTETAAPEESTAAETVYSGEAQQPEAEIPEALAEPPAELNEVLAKEAEAPKSIFCKECGAQIDNPESKFCKKCGAKLN